MPQARFVFRPGLLYLFLALQGFSLVLALLAGHMGQFFIKAVGFGLLYAAIRLIEKGSLARLAYDEDPYARAPVCPCLLYGGLTAGAAIFWIAKFSGHASWLSAAFTALVGAVGAMLYYGLDPKEDKHPADRSHSDTQLKPLHEARARLRSLQTHLEGIDDARLHAALAEALLRAEAVVRHLYDHPDQIAGARKFLVVYLEGVETVVARYRQTPKEALDADTLEELNALLRRAAERFEAELARLREAQSFDLEIDIETLKRQLDEGARP